MVAKNSLGRRLQIRDKVAAGRRRARSPFAGRLFAKQLAALASVVVLSFALVATVFYVFASDVVTGDRQGALADLADRMDYLMRVYVASGESRVAAAVVQAALQDSSDQEGAMVFILDDDGRLIATAAPPSMRQLHETLLEGMEAGAQGYALKDSRQYSNVFDSSGDAAQSDVGDFYGLFRSTAYPWLNVQKKYEIDRDGGRGFDYAISLHAPIPSVQNARLALLETLIRAAMLSLPALIAVGFFFSRRLTKPIKMISEASRKIASGDFSERIAIASRDEIGQLAASFNQMAVELGRIEDARRAFIANVSHELRTPMTSIKGFVDGIIDGTIPRESEGRYLAIVSQEAERLNRLINSLLELARFESGERRLEFSRFDVAALLRRCVARMAGLIEEKGLSVEVGFGDGEAYVTADEDCIEQVATNLLHNAIKFSREGGQIRISVREERDAIRISVADDGIGIDEGELSSIFERFYKTDKSRATDKSGAGLGLAIISNIIYEHRQTINVYSKLGEGSTFEFTLARA